MLVDQGLLTAQKNVEELFRVIELDHQVSHKLYGGIRAAEWNLRASIVQHYCQKYSSVGSFLREEQFLNVDPEFTPKDMQITIVNHALRYQENYVREHVDRQSAAMNIQRPRKCSRHNIEKYSQLIDGLPLWSIIDSFSLGLLARFIMTCDKSNENRVWKSVAADFEIPNQIFDASLRSLLSLRNLVAHQSRLWMRPTTNTGKPPKKLKNYLRTTDDKAMHVSFVNLSLFQGRQAEHVKFSQEITEKAQGNEHYWHGVTKVREQPKK